MSDLTHRIKSAVSDIVSNHFEDEAPFFDQLWTVFWKRLKCGSVEDLSEAPWWNTRETPRCGEREELPAITLRSRHRGGNER